MSNIVDFPNQEKRFDEASLWIARLDRQLTKSEETELQNWLTQDTENTKALMRLAQLWDKMDRLSLLSEIVPVQPHKKSPKLRYALAASFLIACLGILLLNPFTPVKQKDAELAYQTAVGEQRKIFLEDGSTLVLNTDSQVQVIYSPKQRLLLLNRGEIHIDVAHDTSRPLRVVANDKVVQAVGTAFDVRLLNSTKVKVWVTEGRVAIADHKYSTNPKAIEKETLSKPNLFISKGEKVVFSGLSQEIEKISDGEMTAQLGWQQGNIVFRGETLDEAVLEFNRYSDKTFVIQNSELKDIRIAGVFKIGDTASLLSTLQNNFDIHYEYARGNKILLTIDR